MSPASRTRGRGILSGFLPVLPGAGAFLLPIGVCPACWPAYSGLLGSIGFGFLLDDRYLLPFTAGLLLVALGSLAYRARSRRGYGPLGLGALASSLAFTGKFALASDPLLYLGLGMLVVASVWNAWPRRSGSTGSCSKCVSQAPSP